MMYCVLAFAQDGWKIKGASHLCNIPDVAINMKVLMCYLSVFLSVML